MSHLLRCSPLLLTGCFFDFGGSDDDPPIDVPDPEPVVETGFGSVVVIVDGERFPLVLEDPAELVDAPASVLTFQASALAQLLAGVISDVEPLDVGDYPLGEWGSPAQVTEFAFGDVDVFSASSRNYTTLRGDLGDGSFTFDVLDRDAGIASGSWSGEIAEVDDNNDVLQVVSFEGTFTDLAFVPVSP